MYRPDVDVSSVNERKLMRRIDWHVIPWLAVLYLLNLLVEVVCSRKDSELTAHSLDRGSIGNAKLYHLEPDLHINDSQYLIALTVFFFPYSILEVQPASSSDTY
jgi:hypothetical protein